MKTSTAGIAAIEFFEGERLTAYEDSAGVWTIGIGHAATSGRPPIPVKGMTITHEEALQILANDLPEYENAVAKRLPGVPQHVFDGAVSFCFNVGTGAFSTATWPKLYMAGDMAGAEASLKQWTLAGGQQLQGLVNRRNMEADIIFRNKYPDDILSPVTSTPPPTTTPAPTENPNMGNLFAMALSVLEKLVMDNLPKIEAVALTAIEQAVESFFTKVNAANSATPAKTVVTALPPPKT